ncbi:AAA family ATPase [Psychrobacter cibarius]|uniref:AAA family ATPase n=1 Tax=Psychrobacter cibarius TaxID=282669 RepID=UPI003FCFF77E
MTDLKNKIITLQEHLNHGLVGRKDEVKAALLTLLAGENLLLVGPPGTAKSLLARRVAGCLQSIDNSSDHPIYFEYLLTKFSTPEEVFGPLSISELKKDNFKRNTTGYLPTVQIAFLDEIFKASSSILNALLNILNERQYHNGATLSAVPLQALIAASNELPTGQEELNALYDRFLIRKFVDYVKPDDIASLFELNSDDGNIESISMEEVKELTKRSDNVIVPAQIVRIVQDIWLKHRDVFSEDRRESLSDRRLVKLIKLLRISAASNGRYEVDLSDIVLLKDSLWNHPENKEAVFDLIFEVLRKNSCTVEVMPNDSSTKDSQKKIEKPQNIERDITAESRLIKGYKGSGTKNNPILISNYEELLGLERKEVGQQGYYFKQTTDIDCKKIRVWPNINFIGTYDGGNHTIKYKKGKSKSTTVDIGIGSLIRSQMLYGYGASKYEASKIEYLFESVQSNSNLININLEDLCLCQDVTESSIRNCNYNIINPSNIAGDERNVEISYLIRDVKKSRITNCQTSSALAYKVSDSIINQCTSTSSILTHTVTDSTIQLSVAELSIALYLKKSIVKQCQSYSVLLGKSAVDSHIENCIVLLKKIDISFLHDYSSQYDLPNKLFGIESGEIENKSCYADNRSNIGLVVSHLESSKVLNTLVTAYDENIDILTTTDITWSGIAFGCFDSEIKNCVLGSYKILKPSNVGVSIERGNRIASYTKQSTLENNLASDIHKSIKSKTGDNGETIDRARLTNNYYENTLHWDFDKIWQWDEGKKVPVLQLQAGALVVSTNLTEKVDTEDLLTRQICQNIWL